MLVLLLIGFATGCLLTATSIAVGLLFWYYSQSEFVGKNRDNDEGPFIRPHLPQELLQILHESGTGEDGQLQVQEETCRWLNFLVAFVFSELRDSIPVKRLIMKKISKEFEEVMFTKTEGRMIEQLTVRDYFWGTSLPVIKSARLVRVEGLPAENPDIRDIEEIDVYLDVEYSGNLQISIDADLVFDKAANVSFELSKLSGTGRLRFSRKKETTWSFAFVKDPLIELKIKSYFEGRSYHKLSSIIENQLRKWVKKKHTLPAAKRRYKPFFRKPKPQNQLLEVYCHDQKMTVGKLHVTLVECDRLMQVSGACSVFCTVSIGSQPVEPLMNLWKTQWPVYEFRVNKTAAEEAIGIYHRMVVNDYSAEKTDLVVVSMIVSPSAADRAGVKRGDVLTRVNNVRVTSVKQARRLMKTFKKSGSVLILVQRPPPHCVEHLLRLGKVTHTPDSTHPELVKSYSSDVAPGIHDLTASSIHTGNTPPSDSQSKTAASLTASVNVPRPHKSSSSASNSSASGAGPSFTSSVAVATPSVSVAAQTGKDHLRHRSRSVMTPGDTQKPSRLHVQARHTPISSEEERFSVSECLGSGVTLDSAPRREGKKRVEEDTLSLHGVMGERGGGKGKEKYREEEEDEDGGYREDDEEEDLEEVGGGSALEKGAKAKTPVTTESRASRLQSSLPGPHASSLPTNPSTIPRPASADNLITEEEESRGGDRSGERRESPDASMQRSTDDHVIQKTSKEVEVCRHPVWDHQKFSFQVKEPHYYLNVCVWENLEEDKGKFLVGYVTIPLMDIVFECFQTSSGRHTQRYVLVTSSHDRAYSSRTAVQAASSDKFAKKKNTSSKVGGDDQPYSGNILLKFKHTPKLMREPQKQPDQGSTSQLEEGFPSRTTSVGGARLEQHNFAWVEQDGMTTKCDICRKSIWLFNNRVVQCQRCGIKLHKKCRKYCVESFPCQERSNQSRIASPPDASTAVTSEGQTGEPSDGSPPRPSEERSDMAGSLSNSSSPHRDLDQPEDLELSHATEHSDKDASHTKQHNGDSFVVLESQDAPTDPASRSVHVREAEGSDDDWDDVEYGASSDHHHGGMPWAARHGWRGRRERTGSSRHAAVSQGLSMHDHEEDSSEPEMVTPYPISDDEVNQPNLLRSGHLPPDKRESMLSKKVRDIQTEIDRIQEIITGLYTAKNEPGRTASDLEFINRELEGFQAKMDPLKLLMNELMMEYLEVTQDKPF